jgi:hypothetical protein
VTLEEIAKFKEVFGRSPSLADMYMFRSLANHLGKDPSLDEVLGKMLENARDDSK